MDIEKQIEEFLAKNKNQKGTLLIRGPWGVGKTTLVNKVLSPYQQSQRQKPMRKIQMWFKNTFRKLFRKPIKPITRVINLSLFGVSNVRELNSMLISNISKITSSIGSFLKESKIAVGVPNAGSFSFSPAYLFTAFAKWNYEKSGGEDNYIIVIDDIERKDNRLSLEEIFGFVDQIQFQRIKIILIANTHFFDGEAQFFQFKEKVVDREILMDRQSEDVKRSLFLYPESLYNALKIDEFENLRTLQLYSHLIKESKLGSDPISQLYLKASKHALLAQEDGKYGKEEAIKAFCDAENRIEALASRKEITYKELLERFAAKWPSPSREDCFFICANEMNDFECLSNKEEFLRRIYRVVKSANYKNVGDIEIAFSHSPYPRSEVDFDILMAKEHNQAMLTETLEAFRKEFATDHDKVSEFTALCHFKDSNKGNPCWTDEIENSYQNCLSGITELAAKETIEASYPTLDKVSDLFYRTMGPVSDDFRKARKKLFEKIQEILFMEARSFDFWVAKNPHDWLYGKLFACEFDAKKDGARLLDVLKSAACSMIDSFLNKGPNLDGTYSLLHFANYYPEIKDDYKTFFLDLVSKTERLPSKPYVVAAIKS